VAEYHVVDVLNECALANLIADVEKRHARSTASSTAPA
jgi:hypothetical protein